MRSAINKWIRFRFMDQVISSTRQIRIDILGCCQCCCPLQSEVFSQRNHTKPTAPWYRGWSQLGLVTSSSVFFYLPKLEMRPPFLAMWLSEPREGPTICRCYTKGSPSNFVNWLALKRGGGGGGWLKKPGHKAKRRGKAFSSSELTILLVSTKHRDFWPDPIFLACAE